MSCERWERSTEDEKKGQDIIKEKGVWGNGSGTEEPVVTVA